MLDCKLELCHLICFKDTLQVLGITVVLVWYCKALGTLAETAATRLSWSVHNMWEEQDIFFFIRTFWDSCLYTYV